MKARCLFLLVCVACALHARLPDLIPYRKGDLWGFCDSTKKIIIEPQWDMVYCFGGNAAPVMKNELWGLIDKTGKVILPLAYFRIDQDYHHGLRIVEKTEDGVRGAVDDSGRFVIPLKYSWIDATGPYMQCFRRKGRCGILDSNGAEVIPFGKYKGGSEGADCIGDSGLFVLQKGGKWGVIDTAQNVIIPFTHDWITAQSKCSFIADGDTSTFVYYDTKGRRVPKEYHCAPLYHRQEYDSLVNGMIAFRGVNRWVGYKDSTGKVVCPPQFWWGNDFMPNGLAQVWPVERNKGLMYPDGYIDRYGTKYWED